MTYELTTEKFGKWTVLSDTKVRRGSSYLLPCRCNCGTIRYIREDHLLNGITKGCNNCSKRNTTHGESSTRLHGVWVGMATRCNYPKTSGYKNYGGKGIVVCKEWAESYQCFRDWALQNGYVSGLQIDRKNNDLNYAPDNCRFVMTKQQARNRSNNHIVFAFGEDKPICDWAEDYRCVVSRNTLYQRIDYGWDAERAITKPSQRRT